MYTDDKATQLLVALLKEYNIKNVVISPGTRNYGFAESIQQDDFFTAYSVIDERSAAYFATGIAFETGEPVVIACTGATASRNYLSAMTEAYYRHLPIIAVTCGHDFGCPYNITPQYTDRSVSQNDVKVCSVTLPAVNDARTARHCELLLNAALTKSLVKGGGPVHINLLTLSYTCSTEKLPKVTKLDYWSAEDLFKKETLRSVEKRLAGKRIGIMIGAHKKMSVELTKAIEAFLDTHDAAVFADHTSNYHGKNKILIGQAFDIVGTGNVPEIIIDTGGVCGQYSVARLFAKGEVWRVAEDGEIKQRYGTLKNFFECREETFFHLLSEAAGQKSNHAYYTQLEREIGSLKTEGLAFSNGFVSGVLAKKLPPKSSLHLSVLNSLRNMNMYELNNSVDSICNVGGFGIDGPVSTLVGQSMADKKRLYFGLIGDLAFFYDMNILGNRHIANNVRICLVNNNLGVEFRLNKRLTEDVNPYVAAAGHNGSARARAESMGFLYMSAKDEKEFAEHVDDFCDPNVNRFKQPVLFEVFTTAEGEIEGLDAICRESVKQPKKCSNVVKAISCFIPDKQKRRDFRRKHSH